MLHLTYKDKPNAFEYHKNLNYDRRVFFDHDLVMNQIALEQAMSITDRSIAMEALRHGLGEYWLDLGDESKFGGSKASRDAILRYLLQEAGDKYEWMLKVRDKKTKEARYSLDKNAVLEPLMARGIGIDFLDSFIAYRKHKKAAGDMSIRVTERFEPTEVEGISALRYQWARAITGRLYTNNDNIQNINKLYLTSMTVPSDDYVLVWGDFDQIDLRVAYYTVISESPEDDAIFEKYEDKYEAIARIIDKRMGREFNIEKFTEDRKKYKKGILARCYGQSLSRLISDLGDSDFARMLDEYFNTNKRYMQWYNSVQDETDCYDRLKVYTYFGNTLDISLADCTSQEMKNDRILNSPIQSTSNDIVMHMVNQTVRSFRALGYGPDKFRVYMIRHDEPIFLLHKDLLDCIPIIQQNTKIAIDDWGPITMTLDIGKYYSVSELEEYKQYFKDIEDEEVVKIARPALYHPLYSDDNADTVVHFNISGNNVIIGDTVMSMRCGYKRQFELYRILADYALNALERGSVEYAIPDGCEFTMRNTFVNNVHLFFS